MSFHVTFAGMRKFAVALSGIFLAALAGCGSLQRAVAELPEEAPEVIAGPDADIRGLSDPFDISFADVINDFLVLHVSYSGGCEDHDFEVLSNGKYTATYPPEIELHIKHYNNGDYCRGVIDEKRYFDLRPLQYPGTNRIRLVFVKSNRILDYIY